MSHTVLKKRVARKSRNYVHFEASGTWEGEPPTKRDLAVVQGQLGYPSEGYGLPRRVQKSVGNNKWSASWQCSRSSD